MNEAEEKKSNILLLCLGFDQPKPLLASIRVRDLLNVFSPFGSLRKIMIFSKTTIVKAFIEFDDASVAELVKETLHESCVDNLGRARLYYSNREQIVCSNNFLDYWDSSMQSLKEGVTKNSTIEEQFGASNSSPREPDLNFSLSWGPASPSKINNHLNFSDGLEYEPTRWTLGENRILLKRSSLNSQASPQRLMSETSIGESRGLDVKPVPLTPSRVVLASNLENFFTSAKEVFNLFSCFGNLAKVLFMKNLQKALVEFSSVDGAQSCIDHLNKRQLDTISLRISFSKYQKIDLKKSTKNENSQQFNDVLITTSELDRFTHKNPKATTPSDSVLIAVQKRSDMNNTDICLLVKEAVKALGVQTFGEKIDYQDPREIRMIVNMQFVSNSILVITKLHGTYVKNCLLSVSFSS
jgi:hypothetical protein